MMRYRLAAGAALEEVELAPGKKEGRLSIRYPKRMIRLSSNGISALKLLCGQGAGEEIKDQNLQAFADNLENQGILLRQFPEITSDRLPMVSIVIPTYNRRTTLGACLESLINLNYPPKKLEILVVDDGSPEPVEIPGLSLKQGTGIQLIRMRQNSGPGAARNEGVEQAKGEIIAFLDDDCLADKDWLQDLVPCFQDIEVAAAGGRVESAVLINSLDKYEQVQSPLLMGDYQRKVRRGGTISYLATCNLLVRKESLLKIGGFDPRMRVGEDVDLCWRLLDGGEKIYYLPRGTVYHHHRSRFIQFLRRRYNYGQSEAKLQKRYPDERRKMVFFDGSPQISAMAFLVYLMTGTVQAVMTAFGLVMVNLVWQSMRMTRRLKKVSPQTGYASVLAALFRAQGAGIYYFCLHFARYYSIPAALSVLAVVPDWVAACLAVHLLASVITFMLKKPELGFGRFVFLNFFENLFYQAGVYSGCRQETSLAPLKMKFVPASTLSDD